MTTIMQRVLGLVLAAGLVLWPTVGRAAYLLGAGDIVRIMVYNQPDLTTEAQLTEEGKITFPLIGELMLGGLDKSAAEMSIAAKLRDGGFVKQPQVNLLILQYRSQLVSVLGEVNKPGKYSIERASRLTDMLAQAGGVNQVGADEVTVIRKGTDGKTYRQNISLKTVFETKDPALDIEVTGNDIIYVPRAPFFYIYGEVQKPGGYRLERNMTVMQALSVGGGLTARGTQRGIRINRRDKDGKLQTVEVSLAEAVQENDVIYIRQSLF